MSKNSNQKKAKSKNVKKNTNNRERISVQEWCEFYNRKRKMLSKEMQDELEFYRQNILKGIEQATWMDDLEEWDIFEEVKESYSYELAVKGMDYYFQKKPLHYQVKFWAKKLTYKRKPSWHKSYRKQLEAIQAYAKPVFTDHNDCGEIIDIGLPSEIDWCFPFDSSEIYKTDPETITIHKNTFEILKKVPGMVGEKKRKWAKIYKEILILQQQLRRAVTEKHRHRLEIPNDKRVADLNYQAIQSAIKVLIDIFKKGFPEFEERYPIYRIEKGKKRKTKKSTFTQRDEERRNQYIKESYKDLRIWKVLEGGKGKPQADSDLTAAMIKNASDDAA